MLIVGLHLGVYNGLHLLMRGRADHPSLLAIMIGPASLFVAAEARVLGADAYTALSEASDHGYPVIQHIQRLVNEEIIFAPAIAGAFVLTTRGGDFELHLGQDVSIGYLRHDDKNVSLYLQESMTFLLLTAEASVALKPASRK